MAKKSKKNKDKLIKNIVTEIKQLSAEIKEEEKVIYMEPKTILDGITPRNEFFEKLCRMTQDELEDFLIAELVDNHKGNVTRIEKAGIWYQGTFPVLLVAHMDTVHKSIPFEIVYANGTISSKQGIGGDDRCGIYMILEILKHHDCSVFFARDEETGCVGSDELIYNEYFRETILENNKNLQYAIELDRKGSKDAVFYECDNPEFIEFITKEFFKEDFGSFTDICELCPEFGIAGVNFSCGYYKAHTTEEYVVLTEMYEVINQVIKLLNRTTPEDVYEYVESKTTWGRRWTSMYGSYADDYYDNYGYSYSGGYGNKNNDSGYFATYVIYYLENNEEMMEEVNADSKAEAVGKFLMDHCDLTYNSIIDMWMDY